MTPQEKAKELALKHIKEWEYEKVLGQGSATLAYDNFLFGFQAAEKELPTWDDVRRAIAMGFDWCHQKQIPTDWMIDNFIEQLKQEKK